MFVCAYFLLWLKCLNIVRVIVELLYEGYLCLLL